MLNTRVGLLTRMEHARLTARSSTDYKRKLVEIVATTKAKDLSSFAMLIHQIVKLYGEKGKDNETGS